MVRVSSDPASARSSVVTLCHSIEHVPDPVAVRECLRIIRPGGQRVMATPNTDSLGHRIFGGSWFPLDSPRHLHLFNRQSMASMIARAGADPFRIFSTSRDANGVFVASHAIRRYRRFDVNATRSSLDKLAGRVAQLAEILAMVIDPRWGEDLVTIIEKSGTARRP
jgi:predicted SAM-dependent methyltransferase